MDGIGKLSGCVLILGLLAGGCAATPRTDPDQAHRTPRTVRVAGIVLKWIATDRDRNYARIEPLIRDAARQGAELVVTTECFLDGYAIRDKTIPEERWQQLAEPIPGGKYYERLRGLANELHVYLVAGMLEGDGGRTYNTAVLIGPDGRLLGKYHKQDLQHERVRNTPGHESPVFDTPLGRVGLVICADRRNSALVKRIADQGIDLLLCPSGGMWGPKRNDFHLQDRARENGVPIVFVHPIEFLVTGPDGAILDRHFVGDKMDVQVEQIGAPVDQHLVAIFDVPLKVKPEGPGRSSTNR